MVEGSGGWWKVLYMILTHLFITVAKRMMRYFHDADRRYVHIEESVLSLYILWARLACYPCLHNSMLSNVERKKERKKETWEVNV